MNDKHYGEIKAIKLKSQSGFNVEILTFGAILTKIMALDKSGQRGNVVLEYETIDDYLSNPLFLGCVVGPVAGRTSKGQIRLCDQDHSSNNTLTLDTSCHPNSLHSCSQGLHKVNWSILSQTADSLVLSHEALTHPDYGGQINYTLTYKVCDETLTIDYHATSKALTYLSLTNHSYFNLSGSASTPISGHHLQLNCSHFARLDSESLPQELVPISNAALDFSVSRAIGEALIQEANDIILTKGIDHPFKCEPKDDVATLVDPESGRVMHVSTTQPYMVVYSGNFLDAVASDSGKRFIKHAGICFETQDLPDITNNKLDDVVYVSETSPYKHQIR